MTACHRWLAAAVLGASALALWAQAPQRGRLVAVRYWSLGDVTRIAIETGSEVRYRADRVPDPDRIFFDLSGTKPQQSRGVQTIPVGDKLLKQIRIAQTAPGVTRVVLDVENGVEYSASQLSVPYRVIIELRAAGKPAVPPVRSVTGSHQIPDEPAAEESANAETPAPVRAAMEPVATHGTTKEAGAGPGRVASVPEPAKETPRITAEPGTPPPGRAVVKAAGTGSRRPRAAKEEAGEQRATRGSEIAEPARPKGPEPVKDPGAAAVARADSQGSRSLIRALGLKIGRVVLDPGHGGHDTGTIGPSGLTEKELVLDVAKRLGALISSRLGSEVIYTRSDDTFVPLEARTAFANDNKADLFLSIHANSSRVKNISGPETFYLSLKSTAGEMEVAALENATSQRTVGELQDLIMRIARKEKMQESREFAGSIQAAMFGGMRPRPSKNRGVKKAPFVVLIGAQMPSVLAEIGFLSNPREERALRQPEYRNRIAEALFKGLSQYANTLSHFQVARGGDL